MSFERYKEDIEKLAGNSLLLYAAMVFEQLPERSSELKLTKEQIDKLPSFLSEYQVWYTEAVRCISQLLPERLEDFISYYKPAKSRKEVTSANYTISDYLQGLNITRGYEKTKVVGPDAAIPAFQQQINIVKALEQRFESSLFDIRTLVQADVFDTELDASEELNKKGFHRGAGAVAGVVLEGHLRAVCDQHSITVPKKATLGKLNDLLKDKDILDIPTWRFIQHLIDLRNLCDHKMAKEPTKENIEELIVGVRKVTKTVF